MPEENPFEDPQVAVQWIEAVEGERGGAREQHIYPLLRNWSAASTKEDLIVEIGSGQGGCSEHIANDALYLGVEPSTPLIERALRCFAGARRKFVVGGAYNVPLEDRVAAKCFSVNVWFHLTDITSASRELARILRTGGNFLIITANPEAYDVWRSFYTDVEEISGGFVGSARIVLNPGAPEAERKTVTLSRNTFYTHSLDSMTDPLDQAGLSIEAVWEMGQLPISGHTPLFVAISGCKK